MDITRAILHINPDAKFTCWENDFERVVWDESNVSDKPTREEVETAWAEIENIVPVAVPTIEERMQAAELVISMLAEV
jgi:hypothetical protein